MKEKQVEGDGYARTTAPGQQSSSSSPVASHACYAVVRLWVSCETKGGESISVVGSDPALGEWDLARAQPLSTTGRCYPHWVSDVLLLRSQDISREVQFKFAVIRPAADDGEVRFESFNRTLVIPADGAGLLLEPAKPFVFGLLDAHSDLKSSGKTSFHAESIAPNLFGIRRTPSMMAAAADAEQGDMYRVPSLLHTVSKKPDLIIPGTDIDPSELSDLWDRQVSTFSQMSDDTSMLRQESVAHALTNGTLLPEGSGFRRSTARFCIVRFWVKYEEPDDRVLVAGDCQALKQALVLQNSARYISDWISDDVLLEVPPKGTQPRCVKYRIGLARGPKDSQPRFDCERSFSIHYANAGQLLQPSSPDEFGAEKPAWLEPRLTGCLLDAMQDEVRPCGRTPSAAELAESAVEFGGFARQRSVAGGDSMLDLTALAEGSDCPKYCD